MKKLKPLLSWPGGKYMKVDQIVPLLPEHDTYVEPFAGGASIFWNKKPAKREVLGDMNDWLIEFYDRVRNGGLNSCSPVPLTRESWAKVKNCGSPCCMVAKNRMSWHGDMKSFNTANPDGRPVATEVLSNKQRYAQRLRNAKLHIGDFETTMRKYDSPRTVHYLDPPWVAKKETIGYSKKHYHENGGGKGCSVERVAKVAASMKGKVLISYDDSPEARDAFNRAGLHVYLQPTRKNGGTFKHGPRGGTEYVYELLATNFPLPKRVKRKE